MDTGSFIVSIKRGDIYVDIAENLEIKFDSSNYKVERPLPRQKSKKVIWLTKYALNGIVKTNSAGLRPKMIMKKQKLRKTVS